MSNHARDSDFIPSLLEDTDKHIGVADGHHITEKKKGQVRIKMRNNNGDIFNAMLHKVLWAPYLYDGLLLI